MLLTFLSWIYIVLAGIVGAFATELEALLVSAALSAMLRNNRFARPGHAELRFEEEPPDRMLSLEL